MGTSFSVTKNGISLLGMLVDVSTYISYLLTHNKHLKLSCLKQALITSQFLPVRNLGATQVGAPISGSLTNCSHLKATVGEELLPVLLRWLVTGLSSSLIC